MGRVKEPRQPSDYRDDDAASTSSAVPLQEQAYPDDAPPAYTDRPKSVGGIGPRRIITEDDEDQLRLDRTTQERARILEGVKWRSSTDENAKGSTTTYISETLSSDPAACRAFIEGEAQVRVRPAVRLTGTHTETRRRDKKDETTRVTDFDITVPLGRLLAAEWARTKIVENSQKAYRGGIFKQVDPRMKAHAEAAATVPSLQEWCHRFCASSASAKSFRISRTVTELERGTLTSLLTEAIRGTNYRGHIAVTYPVGNRATIIMSDHWINRYRGNIYIWWACVILQLWIFTWPLLLLMTKRWEVFSVEWPCRIYQHADGSWPWSYEFLPDNHIHEGIPTPYPNVRIAQMKERDWVGQWRSAVQLAAESKKRGALTEADQRIAQEVEGRSRQRPADRTIVIQGSGIMEAASGLLGGVQGFMSQSQMANGWGGDYTSAIMVFHLDLTSTLNASQILVGALVCYLIYYAHWQLTIGAHRRRLIKEHGCKPIKNTTELNSWKDLPFGWTQLVVNIKTTKQRKLLECSKGRFLRNGNTHHFKLAFVDMVFTVEPQNVKAMLATHFKDWNLADRRKDAFEPLLGAGIFTTDGAAWQHSRELLKPNFVRNQVADLATFETHVDHLIKAIPRDDSTVDLSELFFRLTIDSATEFLFGESTKCLAPGASSERAKEFANAFNRSQDAVGHAARNIPILAKFFGSSIGKDIRYVHQFVDYYVQGGLEWHKQQKIGDSVSKPGQQYVFLHQLVKSVQDPVRIRSELLNILLAGRDTTASLLTNVWFVLARRPNVWTKLRAEVDALGGEQPTFEQIKNMKYLRYVMNEALRLYPVVPSNSRMAIVDTVLPLGGGPDGKSPILIPAKSTVNWNLYTMHRRAEYFGNDAEEFKPERWETLRPGWEYLPFNGGPRICIGQQFALTEASYTTIRLMQEFKGIESRDPDPWTESITITAVGKAAKVALTPA
ncbi:MAG: hypothetical protein Q9223_006877 [Gallowayella weberi]